MPEKPFWEKETFLAIILISICPLLYFFRFGVIPLGNIDEALNVSKSKDMVL